jgi:hypothetical protein
MIAVILPSRGLSVSRTIEHILRNLKGHDYKIYFSHKQPIPTCFNKPLAKALKNKAVTHIWFVEDDMKIPDGTLDSLLALNKPAVACDYPVTETSGSMLYDPSGKAYFSGTGCLLVRREVLTKLKNPMFRSDIAWAYKATKHGMNFIARKAEKNVYGYHDVTLGLKLYLSGTPIEVSEVVCGQYKLMNLGEKGTNAGQHTLAELNSLKKLDFAKTVYESEPDETADELFLLDKELIRLSKQSPLVQSGKAKQVKLQRKYITLDFADWPELLKEFV